MKTAFIKRFTVASLALLFFLGFNQIQAQTVNTIKTNSGSDAVSESQKKAFESIIKEYLLTNPSVIREAMQALEIKEAKEKQELAAKNLKSFEKEIFADPNTPTAGSEKADISIVAFFDYNCGYCKSSLPMLNEILASDTSVRIVYKEYPILSQSSQLGARAALAARSQGKYLEFHNALIAVEQITEESIKTIAAELGLNYKQLQQEMNDEKINVYLSNNYRLAGNLNIQGTPAYIVGTQLIPGAIDINYLKNAIEDARAKNSGAIHLNKFTVAK